MWIRLNHMYCTSMPDLNVEYHCMCVMQVQCSSVMLQHMPWSGSSMHKHVQYVVTHIRCACRTVSLHYIIYMCTQCTLFSYTIPDKEAQLLQPQTPRMEGEADHLCIYEEKQSTCTCTCTCIHVHVYMYVHVHAQGTCANYEL